MKFSLCLALLFAGATLYAQDTVYLSPQGSDAGNGSQQSPFYSLNKAIDGRIGTHRSDTLFVEVAPGTYWMDAPLLIDQPTYRPVVFRSVGTEKPVFSGGITVSGWERFEGNIFRAYVPEVKRYGFKFEQFYVDGNRATPAKTPNDEWLLVKGSKEVPHAAGTRAASYATQKIEFNPSDIRSLEGLTKEELESVYFRFYHKWDNTRKHIDFLDVDSGYIFLKGEGMKAWNPITTGSRFVMFGYKKALDVAGEWYLDQKEGYVYYMPREGEDMNSVTCVAPALSQLVCFKGRPDHPVSNLSFKGLSFQYTSYTIPAFGNEPMQAAAGVEAGLEFDYAEHIQFIDCEVQHTGAYGMWFRRECHSNRVEHCYIGDLGAGGIKIGEPYFRQSDRPVTSGNVVNNSIIAHGGYELPCGVGIGIFHASDNKLTHNDIFDLYYSGVSVGWVWGYNHSNQIWTNTLNKRGEFDFLQVSLVSPAIRNLVAYNHVHHIGWGELSDMGAVYTLGESHGTCIVHNVIHDILSYDYGGWGLYTDEGSTGVEMSNNLVYRCKSGGFHQHYGKENKIENNIFAFGHYYQVQYTRPEEHVSFSFKHNIILQNQGETLSGPWVKGQMHIGPNLYWYLEGQMKLGGLSFKEWKRQREPLAVNKDPLFVDALHDDFHFKSLKNVKKIGFEPFDYTQAGVYGSDEWKQKAQLSDDKVKLFQKIAAIRLKK